MSKKFGKRLFAMLLAVMMVLTVLPFSVFVSSAAQTNKVGDGAIKGQRQSSISSFEWTSIPGHRPSTAANNYTLIDGNGVAHNAYCIDSTLANGVGKIKHTFRCAVRFFVRRLKSCGNTVVLGRIFVKNNGKYKSRWTAKDKLVIQRC